MQIIAATPDMQGNIADLMYSAGPELYDFIYKTTKHRAQDFIQFEFESGKGFCGYRNVTVAMVDGKVVATGCFFDGRIYPKLTLATLKNIFRFYGPLNVWPILLRLKHVESVMQQPRKTELYLSNFGVEPVLRSTGIGKAMLEHKIAEARQQQYRIFSLDVADTNPRAQALYERMGLRAGLLKKFSGKRSGIKVPNAIKMELVL